MVAADRSAGSRADPAAALCAADVDRLSGDHRALRRQQQRNDVPDILRLSLPGYELPRNDVVNFFARNFLEESSIDRTRGDRVDCHAVRSHLARENTRESFYARLRRDVHRFALDCEWNTERRK